MDKINVNVKQWSLGSLENEVTKQLKSYNKEKTQIRNSDEPRLNIPGQKDYELNNLRKVYDFNIKAIETKHNELGQELIADQEATVRNQSLTVTQSMKDKVEKALSDFNFYYVTSTNELDKKQAISGLSQVVGNMSEYEHSYFRSKVPEMMNLVKDDSVSVKGAVRGITEDLKSSRTDEEKTLDLLKQEVATGPSTEHRMHLIAEKAGEKSERRWNSAGDSLNSISLETEYKDI